MRNSVEPRERHDAAYYLFEVVLKYLASIAIAAYLASGARDHRVNAALKGLARPSLGEWLRFLRECVRFLGEGKEPAPTARALGRLLEEKEARWGEAVALLNALHEFLSGRPSRKESVSLEMLLGELVAYRNRVLGHGAILEAEHYRRFGDLFAGAFPEVLREAPLLQALRLVSFSSIQVREASRVECGVVEFMGLAPSRRKEPLVLPYGSTPPREGRLHLLTASGEFLSLHPLLLAHREDVYFLNEVEGTPEYLSYTSGERHRPPDLSELQGELFERVLGYRLDSSRLSRMGDDLLPEAAAVGPPPEDGSRRLGDYRIVRELGRGAMGVVFEAIQESLARRVALKVLPGSFALDPRRVERFRREARATAQVHHPSIVPVYEVGETEGNHFYAMEYIDGPPLDRLIEEARVARDRAPEGRKGSSTSDPAYIATTVEQMASLAEGLEAAHRLRLIHRDVKPSNVLVDAGGRYVLVDFGLVQEVEAQSLTRSGEMVGTLGYMSPEQVCRGKVDARSDVYSLGATLYEALTLRTPHPGASDQEVQRAILFEEPVPPRKLNPKLNRDLETILLHALEKNPDRRYSTAGELAADLRRFLRYEPIQARPRSALTRLWIRAWRHRGKVPLVLALALAVAGGLVAWRHWPEKRLVLVNQVRLTHDAGLTMEPSLSPDGKLVAYASDRGGEENLDIWVQSASGGEPRRLTAHPADDREPAFHPAGAEIAFCSERDEGGVYTMPVISDPSDEPRRIARHGQRPRYSPDGYWIAYWVGVRMSGILETGKVFVTPSHGGPDRQLQPHFSSARFPIWSPSGEHLVFVGHVTSNPGAPPEEREWDWWVSPLEGSAVKTGAARLLARQGVSRMFWTAPESWVREGEIILFSAWSGGRPALWALPVSTKTYQASGTPRLLTSGSGNDIHPWATAAGRLAFTSEDRRVNLWNLPLSADEGRLTGAFHRLNDHTAGDYLPCVAADGVKLAFISNRSGNRDLWLRVGGIEGPLDSSTPDKLETHPVLSPDGSKLAFARVDSGKVSLLVRELLGGKERTLLSKEESGVPWDWSPDGKQILYNKWESPHHHVWSVAVASGEVRPVLRHPEVDIHEAHLSADGRWVAFTITSENPEPRAKIFVAPYHETRPIDEIDWVPVTGGFTWDDKPRWSPDGNHLYFLSHRDGFLCIWKQRLDAAAKRPAGEPEALHHFHSASRSPMNLGLDDLAISVARDRLVINLGERTGNIWLADLEAR